MRLNQFGWQAHENKRPAIFVHALELQGKLSLSVGEFGTALRCFRQVLDLCARRGFVRASVAATLNLAHTLIFLNQALDARRHLLVARGLAQKIGDLAGVARADWLLQLASARTQSLADVVPMTVTEQWGLSNMARQTEPEPGRPEAGDAPPGMRAASADADGVNLFDLPQPDNYLAFFEDRALGFHWLLGRRDFGACAAHLTRLEKIFAHTDSVLIKLRLRVLSGLLAYYHDEFASAEELFAAVQPQLRRLGLMPELWQAQRVLGWCRLKLGRDEATRDDLATENARLLDAMADNLTREDRAFFLFNKWTSEEEELAARINRLVRLKEEFAAASWHRRRRLRRQLNAQLDELLRAVDHYRDVTSRRTARGRDIAETYERRGDLRDAPPTFWRRLWQRPWRHATLSFLVLPDRVLVVRRGWLALDFGVSPVTRLEIREAVRRWHEIIAQITQVRARGLGEQPDEEAMPAEESAALIALLTDEARQIADHLSGLLRLPSTLDGLPRSTRSLTLVPDDILHGFPFAATTYRGRYLIERYALAFAYRSEGQGPVPPVRRRSALLVGASRGGGDWDELEFVPEELDSVASWATRRKLKVQRFDDALPTYAAPDKATVLAMLSQTAFAHLACHGLFTPDQPAQSGIVLRPAQQPDVLSVQELYPLDLTNLRHVTLSACWSADHFILPGRWVISLPETLARAGAASVLGCLWLVDDRVGAAFMAQFYQYLNKHTRAEALRRTQLACLNGQLSGASTPDTAHPIYWAGYQLYGRGDTLKLKAVHFDRPPQPT